MNYKLLGNSGLRVSELCLGTMTFGEEWGFGATKEESKKIFDAYAEKGGNFLDTANLYTNGTSEIFTGEFIASERERFVLATKYTLGTRKGDPNAGGNHRKNMVQAVEASLKRLNTPYIDLYWLHAWDFMTPVDEVMRGLDDLVRQGKILYIGISDTPAWIVSQANTIAALRGWTPFVALQIEYSLIERTPERDLLPMAKAFGLTVTPWGALGGGMLSGKYSNGVSGAGSSNGAEPKRIKEGSPRLSEQNFRIAEEVGKVAKEVGCSASQVALNWTRAQGNIIPILGARTASQLADNLGSLDAALQPEHIERLNAVSKITLGFPHDFLAGDNIRDIVFSGTYAQIEKR